MLKPLQDDIRALTAEVRALNGLIRELLAELRRPQGAQSWETRRAMSGFAAERRLEGDRGE